MFTRQSKNSIRANKSLYGSMYGKLKHTQLKLSEKYLITFVRKYLLNAIQILTS